MVDGVLGTRAHADSSLAASSLTLVRIDRSALEISTARDRDRDVFLSNEILNIDLARVFDDLGPALVTEVLLDFFEFLDDHGSQLLLVAKDLEIFGDHALNLRKLVEDLLLLHACQALELQFDNRLCLALAEVESIEHVRGNVSRLAAKPRQHRLPQRSKNCLITHQRCPGFTRILCSADRFDHQVEMIQRLLEAEEEVLTVPSLAQQEVGPAPDYVDAVIDKAANTIEQTKLARLTIDD